MDSALEFVLELFVTLVGVGGLDEVVDESKEESTVAGAHELLGGFGFLFPAVEREAAFVVAIFALTRAEGFLAHGWDPFFFVAHGGSFKKKWELKRCFPEIGKSREDTLVDETGPLFVAGKAALGGIHRHFFEISEAQAKDPRSNSELLGHFGITHQAIVGVEEDAESGFQKEREGVGLEVGTSSGVDVTGEAHFKRNTMVEDIAGEGSQLQ